MSTTAALIHLLQSIASLLETNFVIVYALEAFDSVRHSTVLSKMSLLDIPDNIYIYNWIESFFHEYSHCTKFGHDVSFLLHQCQHYSRVRYRTSLLRC